MERIIDRACSKVAAHQEGELHTDRVLVFKDVQDNLHIIFYQKCCWHSYWNIIQLALQLYQDMAIDEDSKNYLTEMCALRTKLFC